MRPVLNSSSSGISKTITVFVGGNMKLSDYKKSLLECDFGLYVIYWTSGGSSLAAVGQDHEGNRWIAPTNWTCEVGANPTSMLSDNLKYIEAMVKVDVKV
jgi:hypothetical protein